ncbi:MAG TPA: hypothetical protein PLE32_11510 [Haliscomenobacter sp.]|nr:hypothetical protein [Haliscomenobacter sp.]
MGKCDDLTNSIMKRFTLFSLVLLVCCPLWAQAQLSKGTWYTGGYAGSTLPVAHGLAGLSYSNEYSPNESLFGLSISPEFGYFFSSRLLVGSRLSLSLLDKTSIFGGSAIGAAPFVRYYLNPQAKNSHFFVNAQLNLFSSSDLSFTGANAGVGMTHFLAPGIGLDAYLALVEPDFQIRKNTQFGLFTSLNVYLNPEMRSTRKTALPDLQRGSLLIGGTMVNARFGITSPRLGTSNISMLNLSPNLLYFVTDRMGVGAALNLSLSGNANFDASILGISPQLRYYLAPLKHRMLFLAGAYHYDAIKTTLDSQEFQSSTSSASLALGLNSFFTSNLALELAPNLKYNFDTESMRVGVDLGIQFFLNSPKNRQ